jgi:peptidyl-prolyl cis-trans isomerase B (cyclophilin B)
MKSARVLAGLLLLVATSCGPPPPSRLVAVFVPDKAVVTTAQSPALELRLQNTERGTAVLEEPATVGDGLRAVKDGGSGPLKPGAPPGDALARRWPYGHQQFVRVDPLAAFPGMRKPGAYRLIWGHPAFVVSAEASIRVVEPGARIRTNFGAITIAFHPDDAPETVLNFIALTRKRFYDGLTFHRIIPGFMMQGGCPRGDGLGDPGYKLKAEFNDRKHVAGTVSMARSRDPDSAGSQFFICFRTAPHLDRQYTAFAQVVDGMDVVKKVEAVGTSGTGRPMEKVVMERVELLDALPASDLRQPR